VTPSLPRLNQDDDEEGENIPTVAVKRSALAPMAPARAVPKQSSTDRDSTSDSIELIPDDPSTGDTLKQRRASLSGAEGSSSRPAPAPQPTPIAPRLSLPSVESATMTLPNQLLAPEYIAHQVERLRSNALKKTAEAAQAREEAEAARRDAEAAEEEARRAERAVSLALDALKLARESLTARAAETLEEALSLVDGPMDRLGS
jgi:hypothetical protein